MTLTRSRRRRRFRPLRLVGLIFAAFLLSPFLVGSFYAAGLFVVAHATIILPVAALAVSGITIVRVAARTLRTFSTLRELS